MRIQIITLFISILVFCAFAKADVTTVPPLPEKNTSRQPERPEQGSSEWVDYLVTHIGQQKCSDFLKEVLPINQKLMKKEKVGKAEMERFSDYISFLHSGINVYEQDSIHPGKKKESKIDSKRKVTDELNKLNKVLSQCNEKRYASRKLGDALLFSLSGQLTTEKYRDYKDIYDYKGK